MDARAMRHDQGSGFIGDRDNGNLKEDGVFIAGSLKDLAKAVENAVVIPLMGGGGSKPNPNMDPITNKPVGGTTAKRAAVGATAITVVTATKIILRATVDPAVKIYDKTVETIKDIKDKTEEGLNSIQNWGN